MRKIAWILTLALFTGVLALAAAGASESTDSSVCNEEDLEALLTQYREDAVRSFSFKVEESYFETLRANNFAAFTVTALQCGLQDQTLRYSYSGSIEISDAVWTEPRAVLCDSAEQAGEAIRWLLADGLKDFQVICSKEVYDILKDSVYSILAMNGVEDCKLQYTYSEPRIMYFSSLKAYKIPYTIITEADGFTSAIDNMWQQDAKHFYVVMEPELFQTLRNDLQQLDLLEVSSQMEKWSRSYDSYYKRFEYEDVEYSDDPRLLCVTTEDITDAIRQMGASDVRNFRLVMTSDLFTEIRQNQFAPLSQLAADAGLSSADMKYSLSGCIVYYENAVIQTDAIKLTTAEEAVAYAAECAARGEKELIFFCMPDLYTLLMGKISAFAFVGNGDTMAPLYDVLAEAGVFDYSFSYSSASNIINVHIAEYYPGTNILRAVRADDLSVLTDRERQTLEQARQDATQCAKDDPLDTARAIHDLLCYRVVYTDDESTDEDDTAIGAILTGEANCDGYADAFYLIGTLAGLDVRYQHGDSYSMGFSHSLFNVETHMWNLLQIDGTWRLVDVTWDDQEEGIRYTWFNIGADRARRMHIWNAETTVPLLPETDLDARPENEYLISDGLSAGDAVADALSKGFTDFELIYPDEAGDTHAEDLNTLSRNASGSFTYSWNDHMLTLTVFQYR